MKTSKTGPLAEVARWYRGLSPVAQHGVLALLVVEGILIAVAQRDIQRRPASNIRGPKLLWRAIATQNLVGPGAYFLFGLRSPR
jgi:hypothetical protein